MNQPDAIYDSSPSDRAILRWLRHDSLAASVHGWLEAGLDLLFPPRCAGCGHVDSRWCETCQAQLDALPFPAPAIFPDGALIALAAGGAHEGLLRETLLAFKFENAPELAGPLGARLATLLRETGWAADLLVPVPLHPAREGERGYNQAELMAMAMAERSDMQLCSAALRREVATRAQVGLNAEDRRQNVHGAFTARRELVSGLHVLLVDDVYTTGATLEACAQALRDAGARTVRGLTLTRTGAADIHAGGSYRWM